MPLNPEVLAIADVLREEIKRVGKARPHMIEVSGLSRSAFGRQLGYPGYDRVEIQLLTAGRIAADLGLNLNDVMDEAKRRVQ